MRKSWTLAAIAVVLAVLPAGGCRRRPAPPAVTINGTTWHVEIADTREKKFLGLSGRKHLDEQAGMLFVHERPKVMAFVMRGMFIPLDIAFINADGRIIRIYTMPVESDQSNLTAYSSEGPAKYVLEVNAGAFARAGVKEGDEVTLTGQIVRR
ncbi:hypothetical protein LCGC14_0284020 [marine sediment metagenome]|uniref:DUF192 domain-containing protein n=1 Tax=marine sediment metagenome TaxID=412755 RepID=A0A0F9UBZ9_9ZZZZ|nr:DUF192 domain-containing protein [Phycisphaerae bacterium]HDZ43957.1 DUF192 domain-containing protein [Phycisphaerae bacterium]